MSMRNWIWKVVDIVGGNVIARCYNKTGRLVSVPSSSYASIERQLRDITTSNRHESG